MLNKPNLDAQVIANDIRGNFARIEIYFEALNFQRLWETAAYDITAFLSDFGGNIGLWLGWSVLAVFEVFQFCYECSSAVIMKSG